MKRCPTCNRTYTDDTLRFCLDDGTPLANQEASTAPTIMGPIEPPATIAFDPTRPTINQPQGTQGTYGAPAPVWTPQPQKPKRKVWPWVVGGLALLLILGGGLVGVFIALTSLSSDSPSGPSPSSSPTATPRATPTPAPSPTAAAVEVSAIHMAHDRGDGEPGVEGEKFTPSERILHCVIELSNNQPNTVISFKWIAVDAGTLKDSMTKEMLYTTKGQEPGVHADLTRHEDWIPGEWKVDVYLNGQFARSVHFTVE